jgi:hypothetical protein
MNKNNITAKIWLEITVSKVIRLLNIPGLTPELIPDLCRYNPQKVTDAALEIAYKVIEESHANVVALAAATPLMKTPESFECIIILSGSPEEIEKFIGHEKSLELIPDSIESKELAQYERMKQSAFNLMRKRNIRNFSDAELHRVFKHAKEQLLYTSIVKMAIEDGLTVNSLYEQGHDHGLER